MFDAIISAILPVYEDLRDEESEIAHVVDDCVVGLASCLERLSAPDERESVLRSIFAVYRWDALETGSYGMDEVPRAVLLDQTTPEE